MGRLNASVSTRLLSRIVKKDGCWGWAGYKDAGGYGRLMTPDGPARAHRLSYEYHSGPICDGGYVLHKCDNPECTNPDHLYVGTHDDNMADKAARGRVFTGERPRGEQHRRSKLTADDVRRLRGSQESNASIARSLGVSAVAVRLARIGQTWAHLT
jgi:hypothetical protein